MISLGLRGKSSKQVEPATADKRSPRRKRDGNSAEASAARWLSKQGCRILHRNYSCRRGEIDLIAEHDDELVFVEVRYRGSSAAVDAASSVDIHKQRRLISAAAHFLAAHPQRAEQPMRFDVLAMSGSIKKPETLWIRDAFQ